MELDKSKVSNIWNRIF